MDRGTWWASVHRVAKSWTRLSNFTFSFLSYQRCLGLCCNCIMVSEVFIGRKKRKRLPSHPSNNQSERAENSQEKYNRCPINKKKKTQLIGKQPSERQLLRTSLEVQWIGIYLPTQGTRVRSLVREDATCFRQLKAKSHSYRAPVPQLLKPVHREPVLQGKRSHWNETPQDGSKD